MSDIVTRLIALAGSEHDDLSIGEEAAAVIERLRAERDEARAACAGMRFRLMNLAVLAEGNVAGGVVPFDAVKALCEQSTTIGADVLAVVEAARVQHEAHGAYPELISALAKLGEER